MNDEKTYRNLLIAIVALSLPIGVYFRIRSHATREKLARREEGLFLLLAIRLGGLAGWVAIIAWMIDPASLRWACVPLPAWLRMLGAAIGLVVVPLLLSWTFHSLGKNLTDTVVTRRDHSLVTSGPYRWVRHPFYGVVFLMVLSLGLLTANALIALLGLAVVALMIARTPIEERKLAERFGAPYRDYLARTPRFLPGAGRSPRE